VPSDPFYHDLFFDNKISSQQQQQKDASADDLGEKKDAAGGAKKAAAVDDPLSDLHTNVKNLETAVDRLWSAELELTKFHAVMGPFLKSGGGGADEIKSVRVMGKRVSTTEATLAFIGRDKPLGTAFDRSMTLSCISTAHFSKIVDFARRQRIAPRGSRVRAPTAPPSNQHQLQVDLQMYGLQTADIYTPLMLPHEMQAVIEMTGKENAKTELLFKSSRDGKAYPKMLSSAQGKSGLLFALQDNDTHRFGTFIDGELTSPDDPDDTDDYSVPVFFFSLSGAYNAPTKIDVPEEDQEVAVAGTEGAVEDDKERPRANVCIGDGYLWLGYGDDGPAADLSSCNQRMPKDLLLGITERSIEMATGVWPPPAASHSSIWKYGRWCVLMGSD